MNAVEVLVSIATIITASCTLTHYVNSRCWACFHSLSHIAPAADKLYPFSHYSFCCYSCNSFFHVARPLLFLARVAELLVRGLLPLECQFTTLTGAAAGQFLRPSLSLTMLLCSVKPAPQQLFIVVRFRLRLYRLVACFFCCVTSPLLVSLVKFEQTETQDHYLVN